MGLTWHGLSPDRWHEPHQSSVATAEGTSLEENSRLMSILEERWRKIKGVKNLIAIPNRQDNRNVIYIVCEREEDSGVPVGKMQRQANAMPAIFPSSS